MFPGDPAQLGLPPLDESEVPGCSGFEGTPSCTREGKGPAAKPKDIASSPVFSTC